MQIDPQLEEISDRIRNGEPVSIFEAIGAINYQEAIKIEKQKNSFFRKLIKFFTFNKNSGN
jgi:hypothetical protein